MSTTMDFFGQQARTRQRTALLCVLMTAAVLTIMAFVHLLVAAVAAWPERAPWHDGHGPNYLTRFMDLATDGRLIAGVGALVLLLVIGTALAKARELGARGGVGVAKLLGGESVEPETDDPDQRKLMNVVEEMAIASGMPVPAVYVLEREPAINAFAAGYTNENAVIGVTRGAIMHLSRDELQGVIAHEFSHILNGDMRLNIRLIGIVHGLMALSQAGAYLIEGGARGSAASRPSGRSGRGAALVAILGLGLMVLGGVGVLFAQLIKAAVARQREMLADAAAAEFTRNPAGLAGALKKIGGHYRHATLATAAAAEASHMYFSTGIESLFDTHPPLESRITQLDPHWDGRYEFPSLARLSNAREGEAETDATDDRPAASEADASKREQAHDGEAAGQKGAARAAKPITEHASLEPTGTIPAAAAITGAAALEQRVEAARAAAQATAEEQRRQLETARSALEHVGEPTAAHLEHARHLRATIPDPVLDAAQRRGGGRAVIYAMLLDRDEAVRQRQLQTLRDHAEPVAYELTQRVSPLIDALGDEVRLILIDLALPRLRRLTPEQFATFKRHMDHLIQANQRLSLFEWMIRGVVAQDLEHHIVGLPRPRARYHNLRALKVPIACLLSTLAHLGGRDSAQARAMYDAGAVVLELELPEPWARQQCTFKALEAALDTLAQTGLRQKQALLRACAACIAANRRVTSREAELLRAISDSFEVPMPPLLPGQPISAPPDGNRSPHDG